MTAAPRVAVHGELLDFMSQAIADGGGEIVGVGQEPTVLAVDHRADASALVDVLDSTPSIEWVQLPYAGIDVFLDTLKAYPSMTWTSAKGAYARPVAEHALGLTIACARGLKRRAIATGWGEHFGLSLYGLKAVVIGAGGVGLEIVRLLNALDMEVTVVRRTDEPAEGAARTVSSAALNTVLPDADVVVVAAALTSGTRHLIGAKQLGLMKDGAILVNIARGPLVDTDAVVDALRSGKLLGAGLDVTDPEPLPEGHPLWELDNALITPHVADTIEMIRPLLAARLTRNLKAYAAGEPLEGLVDTAQGY